MLQVLVHRIKSSPTPFPPSFLLLLAFSLSSSIFPAAAQGFLKNGQFFTAGLAISDAPFPGSTQHAGSNLVIAIEVSGDGKIPQSAFQPGSSLPTRYESLDLYLVSSQTNLNLTVSSGSGLLTQEPGSTVKHLNWQIPTCVPQGSYNLTYYESSCINNQCFYSITPLPIDIQNSGGSSGNCPNSNPLESQPQPASPPSVNPVADPNAPLSTGFAVPTRNPNAPPRGASPTVATTTVTEASITTDVIMSVQTLTFTASGDVRFTTT
ncbi:hypothetical protein BD410DRAFT_780906 [Rickenella mellea]|uniref:Uncharacterized protein n=1 Tax=Rickenella mellea TaxID=50990 RepID=A0A4Y7QL81_9AGAM|nr:hypothetical protein BD410DRAFT_780906 [Rickenella mellea]